MFKLLTYFSIYYCVVSLYIIISAHTRKYTPTNKHTYVHIFCETYKSHNLQFKHNLEKLSVQSRERSDARSWHYDRYPISYIHPISLRRKNKVEAPPTSQFQAATEIFSIENSNNYTWPELGLEPTMCNHTCY